MDLGTKQGRLLLGEKWQGCELKPFVQVKEGYMEEDRDDEGRKCQLETVEKDSPQSWEALAGRSLWGQCNRALIVTSADDNVDSMIRWRLRLWGLWLLVFYQRRTFGTKGRMRPPG